jgi:predicted MFS family arabinose efflux permease
MGVTIDLYGSKRTVLMASLLAIAGALLSAVASDFHLLILGQFLIGAGCSPALVATLAFIGRRYPPHRFTQLSGFVMSFSGLGLLLSATPLAWLVQESSWRIAFLALAILSALAWLAVLIVVREAPEGEAAAAVPRENFGQAMLSTVVLLRHKFIWGILALGAVNYAAAITLRGLWGVPLFTDRHGFTGVEAGNVMLVFSLTSLVMPLLVGQLQPSARGRRFLIIGYSIASFTSFALMLLFHSAWLDMAMVITVALLSGFMLLQYADTRSAFPPEQTGRALSLFTMSMFLGIALMQYISGFGATLAPGLGLAPLDGALIAICALLALGLAGFILLPWPESTKSG